MEFSISLVEAARPLNSTIADCQMLVQKQNNSTIFRTLRQRYDLIAFVHVASKKPVRRMAFMLFPAIVAMLTLVFRLLLTKHATVSFFNGALIAIAAATLVYQSISIYRSVNAFTRPTLHHAHARIKTSLAKAVSVIGTQINFDEINPKGNSDAVQVLLSSRVSNEVAHSSKFLDNRLFIDQKLHAKLAIPKTRSALSADNRTKEKQLQYLVSRVAESKGKLPTINEKKCGIEFEFGSSHCTLYKTSYFDAMCSNDAFRSRMEAIDETSGATDHAKWEIDLTEYFPVELAGGKAFLKNKTGHSIANSVGATTVVLTSDGQVVFLRQGQTQISPRSITASSGSMDWSDSRAAKKSHNFCDAVKRGMAREFCEESLAYEAYRKRGYKKYWFFTDKKKILDELQNSTTVTGFFRWVNRSGKPEFVGITTTILTSSEIAADQIEVAGLPNFINKQIERPEDFVSVYQDLEAFCEKDRNGAILSTAYALARICEIAGYENSKDPIEKRAFSLLESIIAKSHC